MTKEFLERCLAEGLSLDQIAERADRNASTVSYHLKKHGLKPVGVKYASKGGIPRDTLSRLLTLERRRPRCPLSSSSVLRPLFAGSSDTATGPLQPGAGEPSHVELASSVSGGSSWSARTMGEPSSFASHPATTAA